MATPRITYANKVTYSGSGPKLPINELSADEANQIKDVPNAIGVDHDALVASKGQPNGIASLGSDGKLPAALLPNFDPLSLPNKVAWWDFSDLSTLSDNAAISIVADKFENGNILDQYTTSLQPIKQTVNGVAVGRFNGSKVISNKTVGARFPQTVGLTYPLTVISMVKPGATQTAGSPIIVAGGNTTPFSLTIENTQNSGIPYIIGNSLASSLFGINIFDNNWHCVIAILYSPTACAVYVDGILTATNNVTTQDFLATPFALPGVGGNAVASFVGDIGEIMICNSAITNLQVSNINTYLFSKYGAGAIISYNNASFSFESYTDVSGNTCRIFNPPVPAANPVLMLWSHPQGQNEQVLVNYFAYPLIAAAMSQGHYFALSSQNGGNSWANTAATTALLNLYTYMLTKYAFTRVVYVGASMGGMNSISAVNQNIIPQIKGIYIMDPAISLLTMYKSATYSGTVDTGYSISAGTLSAAASAGASSISSSISFASGTVIIIDPLGANPEQVTTGAPTGTGPFTIPVTTNLAFAHSSGVKVSDYPTKTAGKDPMLQSVTNFAGKRVRFIASPSDTAVVKTLHTDLFQPMVSGIATESGIVSHIGGHLQLGVTRVKDFIDFINRCV